MGMFDQFKAAGDLLKGMSPDQLQQLMKQAEESKRAIEDLVRKAIDDEVQKRGLVSREEVLRMLAERS